MKKVFCSGVVLGVFCVLAAHAELHAFTLPDGRSIQAEIVDYNAKLGVVDLKLANGRRKKIKPAVFIQKDQNFIREWAKFSAFRDASFFKISCKRKLSDKWKEEETGSINYGSGQVEQETVSNTKFERYVYEVLLENRNAVALENMTFEYRIFYEQIESAGSGDKRSRSNVKNKVVSGHFKFDRLAAKGKSTKATEPVVIHEKEHLGDFVYSGGDPVKEKGDIKGIWIQAHMKGADGQVITRHVYEPSGIEGHYAW